MYLNTFAQGQQPLDMTATDEFRSLLTSAADLGIPHSPDIPYWSGNIVLRRQRFHYLEWGNRDAPPIVLLHGGHQSAHSWDLVSLHLAQHYHVLALDQRGHGDSEWARDVEYTNHTMSLDALAFLDAMELDRPILIGDGPEPGGSTLETTDVHRLLLETAHEAMENAGIAPDGLASSSTGVFVGITTNDYFHHMHKIGADTTEIYVGTGTALNAASALVTMPPQ